MGRMEGRSGREGGRREREGGREGEGRSGREAPPPPKERGGGTQHKPELFMSVGLLNSRLGPSRMSVKAPRTAFQW